jgi:hypothetical protein
MTAVACLMLAFAAINSQWVMHALFSVAYN